VISLKKHIDESPDLARSLARAYQSSLAAICRAASRTAPQLTPSLQGNLEALGRRLSLKAVAEIDSKVITELDAWGERSSSYFKEKAMEVREILLLVSQSAQAVGEKDERYVSQLSAFSGRLNDIASLEDISRIRQSLSKSAADLKTCVDRMAEDGKAMVSKLQAEVEAYQLRLREAEMQAARDPLTRLDNRRGIERRMEERVAAGQAFTLILVDLNGFKKVNDTHGHLAGDELLKQFAAELRGRFRPIDGPGRWGGDEFLVIFDGNGEQATVAVSKASEWLFGEYRLKSAKVQVTASIGIAQWNGSENVSDTLKRADADMYRHKKRYVSS
jgi:diguanylate cyclase (GGDEF)-like protein